MKTIMSVLKVLVYINTCITARPIEHAVILAIMSVFLPSQLPLFYIEQQVFVNKLGIV